MNTRLLQPAGGRRATQWMCSLLTFQRSSEREGFLLRRGGVRKHTGLNKGGWGGGIRQGLSAFTNANSRNKMVSGLTYSECMKNN